MANTHWSYNPTTTNNVRLSDILTSGNGSYPQSFLVPVDGIDYPSNPSDAGHNTRLVPNGTKYIISGTEYYDSGSNRGSVTNRTRRIEYVYDSNSNKWTKTTDEITDLSRDQSLPPNPISSGSPNDEKDETKAGDQAGQGLSVFDQYETELDANGKPKLDAKGDPVFKLDENGDRIPKSATQTYNESYGSLDNNPDAVSGTDENPGLQQKLTAGVNQNYLAQEGLRKTRRDYETERYSRLMDSLNNRIYRAPGVGSIVAGGREVAAAQSGGQGYRLGDVMTEDMRQQESARGVATAEQQLGNEQRSKREEWGQLGEKQDLYNKNTQLFFDKKRWDELDGPTRMIVSDMSNIFEARLWNKFGRFKDTFTAEMGARLQQETGSFMAKLSAELQAELTGYGAKLQRSEINRVFNDVMTALNSPPDQMYNMLEAISLSNGVKITSLGALSQMNFERANDKRLTQIGLRSLGFSLAMLLNYPISKANWDKWLDEAVAATAAKN